MDLMDSTGDLKRNLETLEGYRNRRETQYGEFYKSLIGRGLCFVAYKFGKNIHFAPSRFVGYKRNDMESHLANHRKDGKKTNPVINEILGKVEPNETMEAKSEVNE